MTVPVKRKMTLARRILTAAALVAMAGSSAVADSIQYTHITTSTSAPFTDNFALNNFDTTLGTLTGVVVTLDYSTTGEVDIFNSNGALQVFTNASSSIPLSLNGPDGLTSNTNAVAGPFSGSAAFRVQRLDRLVGQRNTNHRCSVRGPRGF
jgi:hypothetical protein